MKNVVFNCEKIVKQLSTKYNFDILLNFVIISKFILSYSDSQLTSTSGDMRVHIIEMSAFTLL
ncbi:hypothetical protein T01_2383 [Trichinella spiralis]|uniref:Uncharacterized protein n=1 Tax=Trichinella spiralis TaxID=6334 RepID=A0A0V1C2N0_TRISP|nr:hypothetical protein T01_2383 [Trichinella spiralis]